MENTEKESYYYEIIEKLEKQAGRFGPFGNAARFPFGKVFVNFLFGEKMVVVLFGIFFLLQVYLISKVLIKNILKIK